jgi:hypothetical protein
MKRLALAAAALVACAASTDAQAPNANAQQDQQIVTIVRELQAQQAAIAENQMKIEAKVAALAEAIRVARIYSSRSGQGGGSE